MKGNTQTETEAEKLLNETDGPWQIIFEQFFRDIMQLCTPQEASQIDWRPNYKALKDGLPSPEGKKICDMLFEVRLKSGGKQLIMLHFELQAQKEKLFAERVLDYNWRIYKKHHKPVVSTAFLLDSDPNWRPEKLELKNPFTGETYHPFQFKRIKILDYLDQEETLKNERNPASLIVAAQLALLRAKDNQLLRKRAKIALAKKLFNCGLDKKKISNLYRASPGAENQDIKLL